MNDSKWKVAVVVVAIIAIAGVFTPGGKTVVKEIKETLGALPSNTITDNYFSVGGVETYSYRVKAANLLSIAATGGNGTSTICAFKSPSATSTLVSGSVALATGATTTSILDFARSTNTNASTTKIGYTMSIDAGAKVNFVASTTAAYGEAAIFPPNTYFLVKMAGLGNSFSPSGYCNARFEVQ